MSNEIFQKRGNGFDPKIVNNNSTNVRIDGWDLLKDVFNSVFKEEDKEIKNMETDLDELYKEIENIKSENNQLSNELNDKVLAKNDLKF